VADISAPSDAAACGACERLGSHDPPPRERIIVGGGWSVAHAFNANLEGWLVVLPQRHVESLDELSRDEAAGLGPLLRGLTAALRAVTGCDKTYVLLLAESEGFHHVHLHVVPRGSDLATQHTGPRIFGLLGNPDLEVVAPERMDELAIAVRAHLVDAGVAAVPT
jgi:diadenosine tetraphosphate (Ap4A) HIT family hydrolase